MSRETIPLRSLLRYVFSSIRFRNTLNDRTRLRTFVPPPPPPPGVGRSSFIWSWNSILRAVSLPSLGYLFGWNLAPKSNLISGGKLAGPNVDHTHNEKAQRKDAESDGEETNKKPKSKSAPVPEQKPPKPSTPKSSYDPNSPIYRLMSNPALYDPLRCPRNPIVLAHGLYGFDVRGLSSLIAFHYWSDVLQILRKKLGAEVIITRTPSAGSIQERAEKMHQHLKQEAKCRQLNFIAHSMGGLDCRQLISNIRPTEYTPVSLTTVCTPHRGSPFMDWLKEFIGLGAPRQAYPGALPISPTIPIPPAIISFLDLPAYSNLTSAYLQGQFNPITPDVPNVKYWSVAARIPKMSFFHPLWIPKLILDAHEERLSKSLIDAGSKSSSNLFQRSMEFGNDGLVTVESAKWGEFLGTLEECDHWDIRGAGGLSAHFAEEVKEQAENGSGEDKWAWGDWQRFLGAWGEDKSRRDKASVGNEARKDTSRINTASSLSTQERREKAEKVVRSIEDPNVKQEIVEKVARDNEQAGSGNASTMDSILDWVVENVPGIEAVKAPFKLVAERTILGSSDRVKDEKKSDQNRPPRFDLEKFYLALGRKLYDEGL